MNPTPLLLAGALVTLVLGPLRADPERTAAHRLGGRASTIFGIATDAAGAAYVVGDSNSPELPGQIVIGPGQQATFVAKLSPDGGTLHYVTRLPGLQGRGIAADGDGNVYVVGTTRSGDLPGPVLAQAEGGGERDVGLVKLGPNGDAVLYSTYLGGARDELARAIAVDAAGAVYLAGISFSADLPTTPGAAQRGAGGRGDAFVAKLNPAGDSFAFITFLGGTNLDVAADLAVDDSARVYVTGVTRSPRFTDGPEPQISGPADSANPADTGGDAFVARLSASGASVDFVTLLRGSNQETAAAIALDSAGRPIVLGATDSADFRPFPEGQSSANAGYIDLFVTRLSLAGEVEWATCLGTAGFEGIPTEWFTENLLPFAGLGVDPEGNVQVAASTWAGWAGTRERPLEGANGPAVLLGVNRNAGQPAWVRHVGGLEPHTVYALARAPDGALWTAGVVVQPALLPVFPTSAPVASAHPAGQIQDGFVVRWQDPGPPAANTDFAHRRWLTRSPETAWFTLTEDAAPPEGPRRWWSWVAPHSGRLTVQCDRTSVLPFEPILTISTGDQAESLVLVADNATATGRTHRLRVPVTAGRAYHLGLNTVDGRAGEGLLSIEFSEPANDDFGERALLPGELPVTFSFDNRYGSTETGEHGLNPWPGLLGFSHSLWWEWTSPSNTTVTASIVGAATPPAVQFYLGDALGSLSAQTPFPYREITLDVEAGQRYAIGVFASEGNVGPFEGAIRVGHPPPNDLFAQAADLTPNAGPLQVSTRVSTPEPGDPVLFPPDQTGFHSLWWKWTPAVPGYAHLLTWRDGATPAVALFEAAGPGLSGLRLVLSDVQVTHWSETNEVRSAVAAGVAYYILVNDFPLDVGGLLNLELRFAPFVIMSSSLHLTAQGELAFDAAGEPGVSYQIEFSADLVSWEPAPGGLFVGPSVSFREPLASGGRRFYRIRPTP